MLPRALNLLSDGGKPRRPRGVDIVHGAATGVPQRVAGDRRGGVARRADRLHRHHRAAPGAADGGLRSPHRAARLGAVRRGVPGAVRPRGAHGDVAGRDSRRRRHGVDRRAVLPLAVGETIMNKVQPRRSRRHEDSRRSRNLLKALISSCPSCLFFVSFVVALFGANPASGSSRWCRTSRRSCSRSAPGRRWSPSAPTTSSRPKCARCRPSARCIDPDTERIISLRPDLVVTYGSQTDLQTQLKRASIAFFDYRHGGLDHIMVTMRALGQRTGHVEQAEQAARALRGGNRRRQEPRRRQAAAADAAGLRARARLAAQHLRERRPRLPPRHAGRRRRRERVRPTSTGNRRRSARR